VVYYKQKSVHPLAFPSKVWNSKRLARSDQVDQITCFSSFLLLRAALFLVIPIKKRARSSLLGAGAARAQDKHQLRRKTSRVPLPLDARRRRAIPARRGSCRAASDSKATLLFVIRFAVDGSPGSQFPRHRATLPFARATLARSRDDAILERC